MISSQVQHRDLTVTWEDYDRIGEQLVRRVIDGSDCKFGQILCIAPSAIPIGDMMSRILKKPLAVILASSHNAENGRGQSEVIISKKIAMIGDLAKGVLLVNDLADSTNLLSEVISSVKREYPDENIRTAVLWKKNESQLQPDFYAQTISEHIRIHQPFERNNVLPFFTQDNPLDYKIKEGDLKVTWEDYDKIGLRLANIIHKANWEFDQILCIARGGLPIGYMMSQIFKKSLAVISASSYRDENGREQNKLVISEYIAMTTDGLAGRVLLLDDLVDTGGTIKKIISLLTEKNPNITIRTAVLWKKSKSQFHPNYYAGVVNKGVWIHQPFEKYDDIEYFSIFQNKSINFQMNPLFSWFGEKGSTELNLVGGKGASLSTLLSVPGIQVPEGFIVTTEVYKEFIRSNEQLHREFLILDELSDAWVSMQLNPERQVTEMNSDFTEKLSNQSICIYKLLLETCIPSDLVEQIIQHYRKLSQGFDLDHLAVAVRSSSTAEDLSNASFAGQHDTFLNQIGDKQVLESIIACWASLFHPHTVQYRNQLRLAMLKERESLDPNSNIDALKHSQVSMAVVVQQIIQPEASGVAFNVSPTGQPQIQIEANYGFGETVVGGIVTPDSWQLDSTGKTILSRKLGEKDVRAISKEAGGIEFAEVSELEQKQFVLNDNQILQVANAVHDIGGFYHDLFGYTFIDTEFAVDSSGKLYFLQARPETVFSSQQEQLVMGIPQEITRDASILYHGGATGFPGAHSGRLVYAATPEEALATIQQGDILITHETDPIWSIIFPKLGGIIVDIGGALSHTAVVGREMRIPTILSASGATEKLFSYAGQQVTIDALNGVIYQGRLSLTEGLVNVFVRDDLRRDSNNIMAWPINIDHTDGEGQWSCRVNEPLCTFQLQFYLEGFRFVNKRLKLNPPIETKVVDNVLYFKVVDAKGPTSFMRMPDVMLEWDLNQLEELFEERVQAVDHLMVAAEKFDTSPDSLLKLKKAYQEWTNHLLIRGRFGHGTVATLMQQQMDKIPNPSILSHYLNLRYPIINETHNKQHEHIRLVKALKKLKLSSDGSLEHTRLVLQDTYPLLWQEIVLFASNYEHIDSENLRTEVPVTIALRQLLDFVENDDFVDFIHFELSSDQIAQMDVLFERDQELARIMILSHRHVFQKEKEHHWISKAQFLIRKGLIALGQQFVEGNILTNHEEIFNYQIDEIINKLIIYTNQTLIKKIEV